jgi:hypothetical protein
VITVLSQGPVRKRNLRDVGQRVDLVVDDSSILPIGKPTYILEWDSRDDLFDNLLALTAYDHIDIRTTVKQILDLFRRFIPSDDGTDLTRQPGDKITDFLKLRFPSDTHAEQIDPVPDVIAEYLRILVSLLMPKVEKRYLADQVFYARSNVFQSGRRKNSDECGRIPKIGVECKNLSVFDHVGIFSGQG